MNGSPEVHRDAWVAYIDHAQAAPGDWPGAVNAAIDTALRATWDRLVAAGVDDDVLVDVAEAMERSSWADAALNAPTEEA